MIVTQIINDKEVIDLMIKRNIYDDFLKGKPRDNKPNRFWALADRNDNRYFLFMGYANFEVSEDNGYFCLIVDFESNEIDEVHSFLEGVILGDMTYLDRIEHL